ncbi:MAG: hypothetical protein Q9168_003215 [Polycauliona sp. 1 TL-2023]
MAQDLDDATAATILAIQLRDIQELDTESKLGCTVDCDTQLARRIYQDELRRQVATLRDWHTAVQFGESPLDNEELPPISLPPIFASHPLNLERLQTTEPEAPIEHHDADQPERLTPPPSPTMLGLDRRAMEQERLSRKRKAACPSTPTQTCKVTKLSDPDQEGDCTACMEPSLPGDLNRLPCDHSYCDECIVSLFTIAMKDETMFPPKCCGISIPLSTIEWRSTAEFDDAFQKREVELGTEPAERTYCSNQECSTFIPTKGQGLHSDKATCPECNSQTCVVCKGGAHQAGYCAQDPAVVSLMETAAQEGYKQCPSCHLIIELTFGCNHITLSAAAAKLNSATYALQNGIPASARSGARNAFCSVQQCWWIAVVVELLRLGKLVTRRFKQLQEVSRRIMRAHMIAPGYRSMSQT